MSTPASFPDSVDLQACERFDVAWKNGHPGRIEDYLSGKQDDPRYLATLVQLIKSELWWSWKRSHECARQTGMATVAYGTKIEGYLRRFPFLKENPQRLLELVKEEFLVRHHFGDKPDGSEYRRRFPEVVVPGEELVCVGESRQSPVQSKPSIPGYEILAEAGRGGMGVVFKARHLGLNRLVALKVIQGVSPPTEEELARFRTEAEALARLQNPNIVQVFDVGQHDGQPYCALEFASGGTLAKRIKDEPLSIQQAATFSWLLARAIHAAHEQKVIHRDLKPGNVLLTDKGMLKIVDFGLAKLLDRNLGHTRSMDDFGTAPYMAPEQAEGRNREADARTDVYGLGTILYEMLTSRAPFSGATKAQVLKQVCTQEPAPPSRFNPNVPRDLETICGKCLLKEPERRYASAEALAEDLERFRKGEPIKARPVARWERGWYWCRRNPRLAGAVAAAALAALLALFFGGQALFLTGERKQLQADVAKQEQQTQEAERKREDAELRKLQTDLESSHTEADKLLEQAAARKGEQASTLAAIRKAVALEAEGKKILAALGPSADPVSFASRWQKRKIGLRNEATWNLMLFHLRPLKSLRLPDLQFGQGYSASVDALGTRLVVVYSGAREGFMIDPRTLEVGSLPLPDPAGKPLPPSAPLKEEADPRERLLATGKNFNAVTEFGRPTVSVRRRAGGLSTLVWREGEPSKGDGPGEKPPTGPFGNKLREFLHQAVFAPDSDLLYVLTSHRLLAMDLVSGKRVGAALVEPGPLLSPSKRLLPFTGGGITLEPLLVVGEDAEMFGKLTIPQMAKGPTAMKCTVWTTATPQLSSRFLVHNVSVRCLDRSVDGLVLTGAEDRQIRRWGKGEPFLGDGAAFGAVPLPPGGSGNKNWVSALFPRWELIGPDKRRLLIERAEILSDPQLAFGRPALLRTEIYDAGQGRLLHTFPASGPGRLLRADAQAPQPLINAAFSSSIAPAVQSRDGRWVVVVAGDDGAGTDLELWSLETCKPLGSLGRLPKLIGAPAIFGPGRIHGFFSPGGRWALVGRPSGELGPTALDPGWDYDLWQVQPLKRVTTLRFKAPLTRCDFSSDEKQALFLCGSRFGGVSSSQLVDLDRNAKVAELFPAPLRGSAHDVVFGPEIVLITISCSQGFPPSPGGAYLFWRETGKQILLGEAKWQQVPFAILRPDGKRLLLYGGRGDKSDPGKTDIELWDVSARKLLRQATISIQLFLTSFQAKMKNIAADNEKVVFRRVDSLRQGSETFFALRWSDGAEIKAPVGLIEVEDIQGPWSLWSNYDGLSLFHAGRGKRVRLEKCFGTYSSLTLSPSQDRVFIQGGLRFRQGNPLVSGVWDTSDGKRLLELAPTAKFLGFDALGQRALILDPKTKAVSVHDLENGEARDLKLPAPLEPSAIEPAPVSQGGEKYAALLNAEGNLLVAPMRGLLQIWDLKNDQPVGFVDRPGHTGAVTALTQHPGAGLIVSGGDDAIINLWDRKEGKFLRSLGGHKGAITGLAFSPDGEQVFSASADGSAVRWKTADGTKLWRHSAVEADTPVLSLAIAPDGERLALGLQDGTVALLETARGKTKATASTGPGSVLALAFSADGRTLALGGLSGQVRLFTASSSLEPGAVWQIADSIQSLCFTPAGRHLLVGGRNIQLLDMRSGKTLLQIDVPRGPVRALNFNAATEELVVADQSNQVSVLPLGEWLRRLAEIGLGVEDVLQGN